MRPTGCEDNGYEPAHLDPAATPVERRAVDNHRGADAKNSGDCAGGRFSGAFGSVCRRGCKQFPGGWPGTATDAVDLDVRGEFHPGYCLLRGRPDHRHDVCDYRRRLSYPPVLAGVHGTTSLSPAISPI